ncbi:outer membrane beta-barrel protein [Phenylobacterium sp.]|jgi:hypothetical protein|uniref:outer membrane beta-barrel protein n=1 Tax=Phenylobacterium sp. TaxID=1871053 RepID=UPI002F41EBA0
MLFGLLGLVAVGKPGAACAEEGFPRTRNVAVGERPLPGYEASGFRLGSFDIYPRVTTSVDHDDNIYAADTDPISDVIVGVTPEVDVHSNWARHSLALSANSNFVRYVDQKTENTDGWKVKARGKLDITRELNASLEVSQTRQTEPRYSSAYVSTALEPIQYDTSFAQVSAAATLNRWHISSSLSDARARYADVALRTGGTLTQKFRDRDDGVGVLRVDYALSPSIAVFTEGSLTRTRYRLNVGQDRDSDGRSILAGIDMEITNLITGEISFGHITQSFDDPRRNSISDAHYRARIRWFPTQLITVTLTGNQEITDSGLETNSTVITREAGLQADYELLRNLIINGWSRYVQSDYQGLDRRDKRIESGVGLNYLMNSAVGVNLHYSHGKQDSSGAASGRGFTDNAVGVTLVLQH